MPPPRLLRKGGQHDHHKYDAAGPSRAGVWEENELHQPCDQSGGGHEPYHFFPAILFLQRWPHQQQKQHIAHVVGIIRMTQHMGEKPQVGQRIRQGSAIHAKYFIVTALPKVCPSSSAPRASSAKVSVAGALNRITSFLKTIPLFKWGYLPNFQGSPPAWTHFCPSKPCLPLSIDGR